MTYEYSHSDQSKKYAVFLKCSDILFFLKLYFFNMHLMHGLDTCMISPHHTNGRCFGFSSTLGSFNTTSVNIGEKACGKSHAYVL